MPAELAYLLPIVPAACGLLGLLMPQGNRRIGAALGVTGASVALAVVVILLATFRENVERSFTWVKLGSIRVTFGVAIDRRALYVALAVAIVALAVQVYSIEYLATDDRYGPYAAQVSIFTAAMLAVVIGSDLILVLV